VYLAREQNVILGRAPGELSRTGETCTFERRSGDGRLVVKTHDEEYVVYASQALLDADLKPGAMLRWDRNTMFASERIERSTGSQFFLTETPRESFDDIGGLSREIANVTDSLLLHFKNREMVRRYRLAPVGSVLLHGPAGTGKTLMAKALANWMSRLASGGRSFFINIKPGALHSMWFSQSEANYREVFRVARETAANNPGSIVVLFFDEVDAIGGTRGSAHMKVNDNVLTAFLAELDGLAERGDVLVVGATNRIDALDPALIRPGRLGDLVLEIPRPDRRAARDIFSKHLPSGIPFARNGHGDDLAATRDEILDAAVSTIFAPNADNKLATITFRDGKSRPVHAAQLVNGAVIANITRHAVEHACFREMKTGEGGLTWHDVAGAIHRQFDAAAQSLTPQNCRHHLNGLPHDLDVVNVELVARRVAQPQRYLNAS
jgi:proteasome-associated ATPase